MALQAILGASASLAMAYLSYELFEKQFLKLKRLFRTAEKPAPRNPAVVSAAEPLGERQTLPVREEAAQPSPASHSVKALSRSIPC